MASWFIVLGLPLVGGGVWSILKTAQAGRALKAFPRHRVTGWILCFIAWMWTAYECDTIGIDVFDKYLKIFPGEVWLLGIVLTVLTCWWIANLLPVRALCGLLMLFPGELFATIRLCDTSWRLALVVFAYVCAIVGMFGMFYPWHIRRAIDWCVADLKRVRTAGGVSLGIGVLFALLGALACAGVLA